MSALYTRCIVTILTAEPFHRARNQTETPLSKLHFSSSITVSGEKCTVGTAIAAQV